MRAIGANTQPIQNFLQRLSQGEILIDAAENLKLPAFNPAIYLYHFWFFFSRNTYPGRRFCLWTRGDHFFVI